MRSYAPDFTLNVDRASRLDFNLSWFFSTEYFTLTRAAIEGSHVSTCGHYVHLKCHSQYMDSIQSLGRSQLSYNLIRGFQCPLCRQVSNLVLPCNVRAKQKNYPG